ncbi:MAG: hypothetical protein U1D35_01540 [Paracoccaceae bacterium]|nr:hypothetical protein [Paracoccaceae bacterium]
MPIRFLPHYPRSCVLGVYLFPFAGRVEKTPCLQRRMCRLVMVFAPPGGAASIGVVVLFGVRPGFRFAG